MSFFEYTTPSYLIFIAHSSELDCLLPRVSSASLHLYRHTCIQPAYQRHLKRYLWVCNAKGAASKSQLITRHTRTGVNCCIFSLHVPGQLADWRLSSGFM